MIMAVHGDPSGEVINKNPGGWAQYYRMNWRIGLGCPQVRGMGRMPRRNLPGQLKV
jgi:hypothetical protein